MATVVIKKAIEELKERQTKLERAFYMLFGGEFGEEIKPEYLRKLERIRRNMKSGKGIAVIRDRADLRRFFRSL